jgi:hypothetical protein
MLVEAKLTTGANHPAKLGEGTLLIGDRTEDERRDPSVEGLIGGGELAGNPLDYLDFDRRLAAASIAAVRSTDSGSTASTRSTASG